MSKFTKSIHSKSNNITLEVCPDVGGCISRFEICKNGQAIQLMRPYDSAQPESPLYFGSFPLTPFSNRIGFCKLAFKDRVYHVGPPFGGEPHPNHGNGWMLPWQVTEHSGHHIRLELEARASADTPYSYKAYQTFTFEGETLVADIGLTNLGAEAMPFGFGHHPYFPRTPQTILQFEGDHVWLSEQMVPIEKIPVPEKWNFKDGKVFDPTKLEKAHGGDGTAFIDHCFGGFTGTAKITWPETDTSLIFRADPVFGHFVLYVPSDQPFFCAEPVSNATDGFNLASRHVEGTGMIVLAPGSSTSGKVLFEVQ